MKSYVIHLIRNMPCEGNLEGRYIGRTESPLAEGAITELLARKRRHPYPRAEGFFAAPHTRCVDTLRLLYPRAQPEVVLPLAECDFGDWEGKTARELEHEPGFSQWMAGGGATAPPNGESGAVFAQRVCAGFEMLVQNILARGVTENVLVASAGALTTILAAYGLPKADPYDWMCAPGCGYSARITPSLWMRGCVMEVFDTLPQGIDRSRPEHMIIDLAREAADQAWGREED